MLRERGKCYFKFCSALKTKSIEEGIHKDKIEPFLCITYSTEFIIVIVIIFCFIYRNVYTYIYMYTHMYACTEHKHICLGILSYEK